MADTDEEKQTNYETYLKETPRNKEERSDIFKARNK